MSRFSLSAIHLPRFCQSSAQLHFGFFISFSTTWLYFCQNIFNFKKIKRTQEKNKEKEIPEIIRNITTNRFSFSPLLLSDINLIAPIYAKMVQSTANKCNKFFRVRDFYIKRKSDF